MQMTESQVRAIAKEEAQLAMRKEYASAAPKIAPHQHNGVDNLRINSSDIVQGPTFNGTITMSQSTNYTIPVTRIPKRITFMGGALNVSSGIHAFISGEANFGNCYQFQPGSTTSVTLNSINENIIQGSAAFVYTNSSGLAILRNSQGHIVYASDASNNIYATATITSFNNSQVTIQVSVASGWSISGLWVVN